MNKSIPTHQARRYKEIKQQTFAVAAEQQSGFEQYRRQTRRDMLWATMQQIVPWQKSCAVIEPHYPKAGKQLLAQMVLLQQVRKLQQPRALRYALTSQVDAHQAAQRRVLEQSLLARLIGQIDGPESRSLRRSDIALWTHAKLFIKLGRLFSLALITARMPWPSAAVLPKAA